MAEALENQMESAVFANMQIRQFFSKIDYQNEQVCGTLIFGVKYL